MRYLSKTFSKFFQSILKTCCGSGHCKPLSFCLDVLLPCGHAQTAFCWFASLALTYRTIAISRATLIRFAHCPCEANFRFCLCFFCQKIVVCATAPTLQWQEPTTVYDKAIAGNTWNDLPYLATIAVTTSRQCGFPKCLIYIRQCRTRWNVFGRWPHSWVAPVSRSLLPHRGSGFAYDDN